MSFYLLFKGPFNKFYDRSSNLTDWKKYNYDTVLVNINHFNKMVYYKLVKIMIYIASLVKIIINMVIKYHNLLNSTIIN